MKVISTLKEINQIVLTNLQQYCVSNQSSAGQCLALQEDIVSLFVNAEPEQFNKLKQCTVPIVTLTDANSADAWKARFKQARI